MSEDAEKTNSVTIEWKGSELSPFGDEIAMHLL